MIIQALDAHLKEVSRITQKTIEDIYPKYYPTGAVNFFKNHHNDENIRTDIFADGRGKEYRYSNYKEK